MKIAITAQGESLDSQVDNRFGRCKYFVVFDPESKKAESFVNPAATASGGAGPSAAQELKKRNVQTVITGQVGGNAQQALQAAGIEVIYTKASIVQEALNQYL